MKRSKRSTLNLFFVFSPILFLIAFAQATPDESPCAVVFRAAKGSQIIPPQGRVQTQISNEAPVSCGSMVITHEESLWVKLSNQAVIKLAPHSFVEIPKENSKNFRVYRGQVLVSAPPGISTQIWSTPNSESIFKGGIAWIQYSPDTRVTTVSCFNRDFEFRNKFNETAAQTIRAGEMSKLAIQEAQVVPSQPVVMNHQTVKEVLAGLSLPDSDQTELVAVVKRVYEDRSKSLVSEIQDWGDAPAAEEAPKEATRQIASVKASPKKNSAIDPKEAEFVAQKLREHLYGEDPVEKSAGRKPASVEPEVILDQEKVKQVKTFNQEKKKLEKEIEHVHSN